MECNCEDFQEAKRYNKHFQLKEGWAENLSEKMIITIIQFFDTKRSDRCCYCKNK